MRKAIRDLIARFGPEEAVDHLAWLKSVTEAEGLRLAERVRAGEITRKQVEDALEHYGDAEPLIALRWLDSWGIA